MHVLELPRATSDLQTLGWTIDLGLLEAIEEEMRGQDFAPCMEGIELVLLALETILSRKETA